jgi:hypothetical protein
LYVCEPGMARLIRRQRAKRALSLTWPVSVPAGAGQVIRLRVSHAQLPALPMIFQKFNTMQPCEGFEWLHASHPLVVDEA